MQNQLLNVLKNQGREKMLNDVLRDFREEQIEIMIKNNIDLCDMDRWTATEKLLKTQLKWEEALNIFNTLWNYDIEVLELI